MAHNLSMARDLIRQELQAIADQIGADPRIAEARKLLQSLNALEDLSGDPKTTLGGVLQFGEEHVTGGRASMSIRPDEFYGLEPLEAAKRVLRKLGRSASMAEIMNGIRSGGGETGSEDSLRLSLARSTMEIAKIGDDLFGLVEFYPHIKRGKPGRKKRNGTKDGEQPADATDENSGMEAPDDATEPVTA